MLEALPLKSCMLLIRAVTFVLKQHCTASLSRLNSCWAVAHIHPFLHHCVDAAGLAHLHLVVL